jgi:4-hydroxy-3-methylbut-2-enyl diphosphate reductase
MGQCAAENHSAHIHLVETVEDVQQLDIGQPEKIAFVTQTTLSMDDTEEVIKALQIRFPNITGPKKNDICYATQNRQDAVKDLARRSDLVLVVGSTNSSNSNRLREIAEKQNTPAYLIDGAEDIQTSWLIDTRTVGVTAGASAPELLVAAVIEKLKEAGAKTVTALPGREEKITFSLPKSLQQIKR